MKNEDIISLVKIDEEKNSRIFERGVEDIIEREHLKSILKSGRMLRVKFGIDPTSPDLHLGHAVILRKLRQFQDAGHKAVLIIGDFTARIGDPSDRAGSRPALTEEEIKRNLKKYLNVAGKIINIKNTEVYYNSKWFSRQGVAQIFELARAGTLQQMIRRADFKKRIDSGGDVTMLEMLYPLMQGYDSVMSRADVELGGLDQKLNLLIGRKVQRHFGIPEQDILMTPLLEGTDGVRKMSKSFGNYIALDERPNSMFAKIMSIPDTLIYKYFVLLTDFSDEEIKNTENQLPFEQKKILAETIVSLLYNKKEGAGARAYFEKTFSKKETPQNLEVFKTAKGEKWTEFLLRNKLAKSKAEAKRLVDGGGIDFDGEKITKSGRQITKGGTVRIGKHRFIKIEL